MQIDKKSIVIVIPVYKRELSENERISLEQCVNILSDYALVIVKPESLSIDNWMMKYPLLKTESFADQYFKGIRAYNRLVLSEEFYQRFSDYKYMLIYQLDAYVFSDELLFWCSKGYDYIGAPWLPKKQKYLSLWGRTQTIFLGNFYLRFFPEKLKKEKGEYWNNTISNHKYYKYQVGNGGLSLRRIDKFLEITRIYRNSIDNWLSDDKPFYPEDLLLLIELHHTPYALKKPSWKEALCFAIEENPLWAYTYNHQKLPFGCHAWFHPAYSSFWETIIKK